MHPRGRQKRRSAIHFLHLFICGHLRFSEREKRRNQTKIIEVPTATKGCAHPSTEQYIRSAIHFIEPTDYMLGERDTETKIGDRPSEQAIETRHKWLYYITRR